MPRVGSDTTLRLDLSDGRLWNVGQEIPLTPTSFSMLQYFVLHPNRLITNAAKKISLLGGSRDGS